MNARKEADLINPATNTPLELDLFLPSLHLAFEYQVFTPNSIFLSISFPLSYHIIKYYAESTNNTKDKSHYVDVDNFNSSVARAQSLDQLKQQLATEKGITLIPIPCWWDGTKSRYFLSSQPKIPHFIIALLLV